MPRKIKPKRKRDPDYWLRIYVMESSDYKCVYCFGFANTVDHILPFSKGGNTTESNLVAACDVCNKIASNRVFISFEEKRLYVVSILEERTT